LGSEPLLPSCRPSLKLNDTLYAWVGELFRAVRLIAREQASSWLSCTWLVGFRAQGFVLSNCLKLARRTLLKCLPKPLISLPSLPLPPPVQVDLGGVPLLRLRFDMTQVDPDPRYFQQYRGLMNLTGPLACEWAGSGNQGQRSGWAGGVLAGGAHNAFVEGVAHQTGHVLAGVSAGSPGSWSSKQPRSARVAVEEW